MVITGLLLGTALGFVLQRGRFCVTGAFRDVFISRNTKWLTAFLIVIAVQSVGFFALYSAGQVDVTSNPFQWLGIIVGSLIFGIAIVLAGGCATGTYYRAGEGLIGSWIALGLYGLFAAAMGGGFLSPINTALREPTLPVTTVQDTLGISPWFLVIPLVGFTIWAARKHLGGPKLPIAQLPRTRTGISYLLFEKAWHPFATAIVIGLIAIAAYPLSYATGRLSGLGITGPSRDIVRYIVDGDPAVGWNWGVLLVIGILLGSFIAAKGSGEFRLRVPDAQTVVRSVFGGILMGVGASLAGGCTIGNAMVQTAQFSFQGWFAFAFTFIGVGIGTKFFVTRGAGKITLRPAPATTSVN